MSDLEILKECYQSIKLNYTIEPTLIGTTLTIYPDNNRAIDFEFDEQGTFLRII